MSDTLHGHKARKRFGQNFLNDDYWIEKIASSIDPQPGERVIEIGPGQAALSRKLIARCGHITCVEIDRDLVHWLKKQFSSEQMTLIEADALKVGWQEICSAGKVRVTGNLPYNISSPLLFTLSQISDKVIDQHFMLQKEVVDRMCAEPGNKAYGRLSVMLQWKYRMFKLFDVPPEAFTPAPKVISSVVRMLPIDQPLEANEHVLERVVATGFAMRRKTLRNCFARWLQMEDLEACGISPDARAEVIPVNNWIQLANRVQALNIEIPMPGQKIL